MQKSEDAFRTISEVAAELGVPQHVLRFWESKFTQIKPLKRAGGRRYYRPEDIALLRGIRGLLHADGYTIKGVQKLLKERGARFVGGQGQGRETERAPVIAAPAEPAPVARAAPRRRVVESDPAELSLPFFMPDFLKTPVAAAPPLKPARQAAAPRAQPAQRKKLEKLLAELIEVQGLLKEE